MSEYGYIPEAPEQSFGNNKGIFTPKDIYDLTRADKYTNYGQLELIETINQDTSVSAVVFDDLRDYDIHIIFVSELQGGDAELQGRLSTDGGTTFYSGGRYDYAMQFCQAGGSVGDRKGINQSRFQRLAKTGNHTGATGQGYITFYNLKDSNLYSMLTTLNYSMDNNPLGIYQRGGQVLRNKEQHNAIQLFQNTGTLQGKFSIYGVRSYT